MVFLCVGGLGEAGKLVFKDCGKTWTCSGKTWDVFGEDVGLWGGGVEVWLEEVGAYVVAVIGVREEVEVAGGDVRG